jgi:ABC-2 type transport system permease protein
MMERYNEGFSYNINLLLAIFKKNLLEFIRYPAELLFTFFIPFVWFLPVYFLILSFAPDGISEGLASWIGSNNFFGFFMIGMIIGHVVMAVFWGIGFALKRLMDIGLLETVWVCPISKTVYLVGESLFSVVRLVYEIALLLILYRYIFRMAPPSSLWRVIPYFIPFLFLMYGFGLAFASIVMLAKDADMLVDSSSFLVQTLTGTQNPPQVFPRYILGLSLAIPITYFLDIVRVHTLNIDPLVPYGVELSIFLAGSLVFPFLGVWFFRYTDRRCRIKGNIHVH